ncbi:MAG TPA: N-6 DNA methylase, partial [Acidimicrobiales bacterium]|nr:N-6 DNA methylase [Acidimicrobiales bacterium]
MGDILQQHEYREYPEIRDALSKASKTGDGAGYPELILMDRDTGRPVAVFEAKAHISDLVKAITEAQGYADALIRAGFTPVAIAVAGTDDDRFDIRVLKKINREWREITYEQEPIAWIPNREQLSLIRGRSTGTELRPEIPSADVLKAAAEEINGLLREAGLKDDFRPAAIGAIMLGLWHSRGDIRRDPPFILADINQACGQAFWDAGKSQLALSLHVDEANAKLAVRARRIVEILERLNITALTAEHDYIGALYEEFFRYTGGNTIGQYFTPRHITKFMADITAIGKNDVVLDPACGTGGFLIAALERKQKVSHLSREAIVKTVKTQLIGLEDEPVTAALCVANMILRGDGSSGVKRADAFDDREFPREMADVVLMNPPFPHRKTDVPIERFISRALEGLKRRGVAAVIAKTSVLAKSDTKAWREHLLSENTLQAVISVPGELFQPYASATTAILVFKKGVPHGEDSPVFFCRISNDGFRLKKGVRVIQEGDELPQALAAFKSMSNQPGFCIGAVLDDDNWAPGAYIAARPLTAEEFREEVAVLIRGKAAFAARYAPQLAALMRGIASGELHATPYREAKSAPKKQATIGDYFEINYGQRVLHSKDGLSSGKSLVISSSGENNGAYGFFDYDDLIEAPFVTVPSTGSIGEAAVQEFPCGVTDDCLILTPRIGTPFEALYVAAAVLRHERWRFDYGRKMTPSRISSFPLRLDDELLSWVANGWGQADSLQGQALEMFGGEEAVMKVSTKKSGAESFDKFKDLTGKL